MVQKTVFYCVPKNNLIKFKEDDESYVIDQSVVDSEKLLENILKNGDVVDVEIGEIELDGGEKQAVVKLVRDVNSKPVEENKKEEKSEVQEEPKKRGRPKKEEIKTEEKTEEPKAEAKKETPKTETKKEEKKVEKVTKEILCVSDYGVKFVDEKAWTNFTEELQKKDPKKNGAIAKNVIEATLENGKIVEFKVVATPKEEKKATKNYNKGSSYRDEDATDRRTASMNAKDIIVARIEANALNNLESIEKEIEQLTKKFYEVTKNL